MHHDNAPARTSMLPKTGDTDERKCLATIEEIKEKSKQERISEVFRELKNRWYKYIISEESYFEDSY